MTFKVGDKVRVREDLEANKLYGGTYFCKSMSSLKGKICTINRVLYTDSTYTLAEDKYRYLWVNEMLEPAEEKNCNNCRHGGNKRDASVCPNCIGNNKWEQLTIVDYRDGETLKAKQIHINTKLEKLKMLHKEQQSLYELKNSKYGDSFGISVKKYGLISALTRMSDKWNRIENLILNDDNGTEDESLFDSLKDLSNYALMTVIELEEMNEHVNV